MSGNSSAVYGGQYVSFYARLSKGRAAMQGRLGEVRKPRPIGRITPEPRHLPEPRMIVCLLLRGSSLRQHNAVVFRNRKMLCERYP